MKTSIGYSVILNIVIVFIVIIFGAIAMCLSYYKAFKVSNSITLSIEKYEGYNVLAENEIIRNLSALGYGSTPVKCSNTRGSCTLVKSGENSIQYSEGQMGYCVYECQSKNNHYSYKTTTNMLLNIPIIHDILNLPVESNTRKLYGFNDLKPPGEKEDDQLPNGTYYIATGLNPNRYLHLYWKGTTNGTRIVTYLDHLTENTTWKLIKWSDDKHYLIMSDYAGRYLELDGDYGDLSNANVQIWDFFDPSDPIHRDFLWYLEKQEGDYYRIVNARTNKALHIVGSVDANEVYIDTSFDTGIATWFKFEKIS